MDAILDYKSYFTSKYPEEAVGYFKGGQFYALENISAGDKQRTFEVCPTFLLNEPELLVHSHIADLEDADRSIDPRSPSKDDMVGQAESGIPWGIVAITATTCSDIVKFGNKEDRPPYIGREFIFNAQDCGTLIQDWYYNERGIELPSVPRNPYWASEGENHIEQEYASQGFVEIALEQAVPGDPVLYAVRSKTANHIGIYLGENKVLTHWYNRLSGIENIGEHGKFITKVLRYAKGTQ